MKTKILATNKTCGPCTVLKNKLRTLKIEVTTKDYSNNEDKAFFHDYDIRSVPRLVVVEDGKVDIIQGIDDIIKAIQAND